MGSVSSRSKSRAARMTSRGAICSGSANKEPSLPPSVQPFVAYATKADTAAQAIARNNNNFQTRRQQNPGHIHRMAGTGEVVLGREPGLFRTRIRPTDGQSQ